MRPIHPDVRALVALARASGSPPFEALPPAEARRAYLDRRATLQLPPDTVASIRDLAIAGPGGGLPLRLYRGAGTAEGEALPCLVYLHGGGWVLGGLDSHEGICCRLANRGRCCVLAVDYRLAPEHPFPAAVEDAAAALAWVAREAGSIGVDPARIAVGGDSAGGTLAAVLALMGRDGAVPRPVHQVLLYPTTDLAMAGGNYEGRSEGMSITPDTMRYFVGHYCPDERDRRDWRASPLRARALDGAPPAFLLTCGHDPLCAEGQLYAGRLEREGVRVTSLHLSDQTHGFLTMTKVIRSASAILDLVGANLVEAWDLAERPG